LWSGADWAATLVQCIPNFSTFQIFFTYVKYFSVLWRTFLKKKWAQSIHLFSSYAFTNELHFILMYIDRLLLYDLNVNCYKQLYSLTIDNALHLPSLLIYNLLLINRWFYELYILQTIIFLSQHSTGYCVEWNLVFLDAKYF